MDKEQFISAVESEGIEFAVTEWILQCTEEELLNLWPIMAQEYRKIHKA